MAHPGRADRPPPTRHGARTTPPRAPRRGRAERRHAPAAPGPNPTVETARRVGEALIVALVTSTGLYLVGSVYTDAYYSRLSIEPTALDLAPPYVALPSVHSLRGLLEYPLILLLFWVLFRTFVARSPRARRQLDRTRRRFPRLLPILANVVVVAPLVLGSFAVAYREQEFVPRSVLTQVVDVLSNAALVLLAYAVWLGWSQRRYFASEIRARRLVPIALVFVVYLFGALASTAVVAELAAGQLLTGASEASMRVEFLPKPGEEPHSAGKDLILVTIRRGAYYVVEQEPSPPGQRPTAFVVPFGSVESALAQRLNDADAAPRPPDPDGFRAPPSAAGNGRAGGNSGNLDTPRGGG